MTIVFIDCRGIAANVVTESATIRDAMSILNSGGDLMVLVVDEANRLRGVLTDGDIRRAILRGVDLSGAVSSAMNREPVVITTRDRLSGSPKLGRISQDLLFLPEVDDAGRLLGVHLNRARPDSPTVLVMAGGEGRRLGERTRHIPKPLVPVRGRPMIEHLLHRLGQAGHLKAYISIHHLGGEMEKWAAGWKGDIDIEFIRETSPLGTAGSISLLPPDVTADVLVINADVSTQVDLAGLASFHRQFGADATIATARQETQVPFGVVKFDRSGRFHEIQEKPVFSYHIAAGIYLIGLRVRALIERGHRIDMPELLSRSRMAGLQLGVFPIHEKWRDLGRPVDLDAEEGQSAEVRSDP